MTTISEPCLSFGWIASVMRSVQMSRREKRQGRFKLIAERELRLSDHMLRDIGLTTDDVKRALDASPSWL